MPEYDIHDFFETAFAEESDPENDEFFPDDFMHADDLALFQARVKEIEELAAKESRLLCTRDMALETRKKT